MGANGSRIGPKSAAYPARQSVGVVGGENYSCSAASPKPVLSGFRRLQLPALVLSPAAAPVSNRRGFIVVGRTFSYNSAPALALGPEHRTAFVRVGSIDVDVSDIDVCGARGLTSTTISRPSFPMAMMMRWTILVREIGLRSMPSSRGRLHDQRSMAGEGSGVRCGVVLVKPAPFWPTRPCSKTAVGQQPNAARLVAELLADYFRTRQPIIETSHVTHQVRGHIAAESLIERVVHHARAWAPSSRREVAWRRRRQELVANETIAGSCEHRTLMICLARHMAVARVVRSMTDAHAFEATSFRWMVRRSACRHASGRCVAEASGRYVLVSRCWWRESRPASGPCRSLPKTHTSCVHFLERTPLRLTMSQARYPSRRGAADA